MWPAAFDRSFEGALAACGAPIVGLLAERLFGFEVGAPVLKWSNSSRFQGITGYTLHLLESGTCLARGILLQVVSL